MGQHLTLDKSLNTTLFEKRNLLSVPQLAIRLILNHAEFAVHSGFKAAMHRIGFSLSGFMDLFDNR